MKHKLKCEAKIHDAGFRAGNKGVVHTQHSGLSVKLMLRDMGVRRVTDAKIDKVCYFL